VTIGPTGGIAHPPPLPHKHPNLALVIHGTTPGSSTPFSDGADIPHLADAIKARLAKENDGNWDVVFYNWSEPSYDLNSRHYPQTVARNAVIVGDRLVDDIKSDPPYQKVLAIGHSSGAWMASEIGQGLQNTPNGPTVNAVYLDPFVPEAVMPVLGKNDPDDDNYPQTRLGSVSLASENYYEKEWRLWRGVTGIGIPLTYAVNYDVTPIRTCAGDPRPGVGEAHGWPIRFYQFTTDDDRWNYGYQHAFKIQGPLGNDTPLNCDNVPPPVQLPVQMQSLSLGTFGRSVIENDLPDDIWRIMPQSIDESIFDAVDASSTEEAEAQVDAVAQSRAQTATPNANLPGQPATVPGTEFAIGDLTPVSQTGEGTITSSTNGVKMSAESFLSETFNVVTTNAITLGTLDYSLSNHCSSVVGIWMDGKPMIFIQSAPASELSSFEMFIPSTAVPSGNHSLTISLESLDGTPIAATMNTIGFYFAAQEPLITSQSISNNQFALSWEAGAGLKYRAQYSSDLTSSNWMNLGGLITSPTNAVMSAFDSIATNSQRFYRISLEQ